MDILNQCDQEQKDEIKAIQSIYEDYIEIMYRFVSFLYVLVIINHIPFQFHMKQLFNH